MKYRPDEMESTNFLCKLTYSRERRTFYVNDYVINPVKQGINDITL